MAVLASLTYPCTHARQAVRKATSCNVSFDKQLGDLHGKLGQEPGRVAPVEAGVVLLQFVLDALPGDHQQVVRCDADLDVLLAQPGGVHLEDVGVLGFADVHLRVRSGALTCLNTSQGLLGTCGTEPCNLVL